MSRHTAVRSTPLATRILVPVATLLAAVALTVGSGATFVSSSTNTGNSYESGTLTQTNSKANSAIFSLSNVKPGDAVVGKVTITNSGSLPATFALAENATNGFTTKSNLTLRITTTAAPSVTVWSGTFGALTTAGPLALGEFAAGEAREYVFTVTLASAADNTEQGKSASATYNWNATQLAATTTNQ